MSHPSDIADLIRRCFAAYESKDRAALEALVADDFHFSSPRDNRIDRQTYFERCWPFSEKVRAFRIEKLFVQHDEAFVRYRCEPDSGPAFRNTEFFRFANGRLIEVEVYFGLSEERVSPT
ncbi:nuclear transport factor 2 family protein [Paraburkholderia flava]|uniref:nuclear transport factor 2 family protein n=1 Tax=Paraburkholderia flava TaxID=2547393 RepID=UPI0010620BDB|nr:nuclear transport factor 2 family protein [Paraburkholderia flava]